MTKTLILVSCCLLAFQDAENRAARALIERLRSDSIEEREKARQELKEMGKAAGSALEEATRDSDTEVASTASILLRRLRFLEVLTPRLKRHCPDLENRLARGGDRECIKVLFETTQPGNRNPMPLTRSDLDPLAAPALRGATSDEEFRNVCESIRRQKLKGAETELRAVLKQGQARAGSAAYTLNSLGLPVSVEEIASLLNGEEGTRWTAVHLLESIGGDKAKEAIKGLGADSNNTIRFKAASVLCRMGDSRPLLELLEGDEDLGEAIEYVMASGVREAIPALLKLAENPAKRPSWGSALRALAALRATEAVPRAIQLLSDENIDLRAAAANVLYRAGTIKEARHVEPLLGDTYVPVQLIAMKAAAAWGVRETIPTLRALAGHKDMSLRIAAVEALGALRAREATSEVLPLLDLKDPAVEYKNAAVKALAAMDARDAVPAIAGILIDDGAWSVHPNVVWDALRELNAHEQVDAIVERLKDPSPLVRWSILSVLSNFGWRQAAPAIAKLLRDENPKVRVKAIWTLSYMNAVECAEEIEKLVTEEGEATYPAFAALCKLDPRRAEPHMRRFLTHENRAIRYGAVFGLAKLGDPKGLEALEKFAADPGDYGGNIKEVIVQLPEAVRARLIGKLLEALPKRWFYAEGIAKHADFETQERLASLLKDKDPRTRSQAIAVVLSMGRKEDLPRVRELIEDPSPDVRAAALSALARHGVREIAADVRERLFDVDFTVRAAAIGAVQSLGLTEAAPEMEELLFSESHDWIPGRVLHALGHLKVRASVPRIRAMLRNHDPYNQGVPSAALYALGQIGDASAMADVASMLKDPNPGLRGAAARTLGLLGGREHADQVGALLLDSDRDVRVSAIDPFVRLKGAGAIPALLPLLEDSSTHIRDLAASALLRLGSSSGVPRILRRSEYQVWYPLNLLNGVRHPEMYSRLSGMKFDKPIRGALRDLIHSLLDPAGIALDDSAIRGEAWEKFLGSEAAFLANPGYDNTLFVLESRLSYPYDFVLEKNSVRVVTNDQALAFWKSWWAEQQKTK